jgi:hypothetical protein
MNICAVSKDYALTIRPESFTSFSQANIIFCWNIFFKEDVFEILKMIFIRIKFWTNPFFINMQVLLRTGKNVQDDMIKRDSLTRLERPADGSSDRFEV